MTIFIETENLHQISIDDKNELVHIIEPKSIYDFSHEGFMRKFCHSFILSLTLQKDQSLEKNIDLIMHFVFHKNYFMINGNPVIFLPLTDNVSKCEEMRSIFLTHGYSNCFFLWKNNTSIFISDENSTRSVYSYSDINESSDFYFLPNSFIYCETHLELKALRNAQLNFFGQHEKIPLLVSEIRKLSLENRRLIEKLAWANSQLSNYKAYLNVTKLRLSQGRFYSIYIKLVGLINKLGPLRKFAKFIHSFIFRK